jgi:hypothetical protein
MASRTQTADNNHPSAAKQVAEKLGNRLKSIPQRLKPNVFSMGYRRSEDRPLQKHGFSEACEAVPFQNQRLFITLGKKGSPMGNPFCCLSISILADRAK